MINVDNEIERQGLKSKMIVQVHDELVFEVEAGEEEKLQQIVKDKMQSAYKMNVPLVVDDSFGNNWYEVK
jgi:DNA polymerase-1